MQGTDKACCRPSWFCILQIEALAILRGTCSSTMRRVERSHVKRYLSCSAQAVWEAQASCLSETSGKYMMASTSLSKMHLPCFACFSTPRDSVVLQQHSVIVVLANLHRNSNSQMMSALRSYHQSSCAARGAQQQRLRGYLWRSLYNEIVLHAASSTASS